ncbi:hypothetical protein CS063_10290 [Sporanaerobium hydrogeniformans]|uniref:Uncharacterized protein n=1 Tax=Sporanaerobium hydrogeniformans TaxID=3072179 RepID=A0AC61DB44_9FIRM|nr:hypothetical protein [Sporanaerobium hydrogeniformans]PHV70469.1 hypothetical protein CS063_10290 [Sporanaerobium hydrogeniformans]
MKNSRISHLRAFLVELMSVVLFFSVALALMSRVFAAAHNLRQKASDLTEAVAKVQTLAEYAKASYSKEDYKQSLIALGGIEVGENIHFYYDEKWQLQSWKEESCYVVEVLTQIESLKSGECIRINIATKNKEESIYNLQVKKYYTGIVRGDKT